VIDWAGEALDPPHAASRQSWSMAANHMVPRRPVTISSPYADLSESQHQIWCCDSDKSVRELRLRNLPHELGG
jgi:hypothetical protein